MPVYIDKDNKKIRIRLNNKKHWSSKDTASLAANGSSILVSLLSGVANLVAAFGGSIAFYCTQLFYGLSNRELRNKITKAKDEYKKLNESLTKEGYTIELEEPTGFSEFGLHTTKLSAFSSTAAALLNLGFQAAATANAVAANFTNYREDETWAFCKNPMRYQSRTVDEYCDKIHPSLFEYCKENTCIASYILSGLAILTSTAEQHFKRVHLECWSETLDDAILSLDKLQLEIDIRKESTVPILLMQ